MGFRYNIKSKDEVEFRRRIRDAEARDFKVVREMVVDHHAGDNSGFHNFVAGYGSRHFVAVMERRGPNELDGRI